MTAQVLTFPFEVKQIGEREFEGYGSTFGNVDLGDDIVVRGAFKRTLAEHRKAGTMPLMFWMHDPRQVPGVWKTMKEDEKGLYVKGELVDTQLGNETRTLLDMKAVRGLSIGFRIPGPDAVDFNEHGIRLIKDVDLIEVSVVSLAMNPLARVTAAKTRLSDGGEYVPSTREFEKWMRRWGCSKAVSRELCAKVFGEPAKSREDEAADDLTGTLAAMRRFTDAAGAHALRRMIR